MSSQRISDNAMTHQSSGNAAMAENPQMKMSGQAAKMRVKDHGSAENGLPTGHKAAVAQEVAANDASADPRDEHATELPYERTGGRPFQGSANRSYPRMPLTLEEQMAVQQRHGHSANQRVEKEAPSKLLSGCQRFVGSVRGRAEQEQHTMHAGSGSHPRSNEKRSRHSGSERYQQSLQRFQQMGKKHFKNDISDTDLDNMQSEAQARFKVPFNQAPNKVRPTTFSGFKKLRNRHSSKNMTQSLSPAGTSNEFAEIRNYAFNAQKSGTLAGTLQTLIQRLQRQTVAQQPPIMMPQQDTVVAAGGKISLPAHMAQDTMAVSVPNGLVPSGDVLHENEKGFAFQLQNPITKVPEYNYERSPTAYSANGALHAKLTHQQSQKLQALQLYGNDLVTGSDACNNQKMQTQNQPALSQLSQVNAMNRQLAEEAAHAAAGANMPQQEQKDSLSAGATNHSFPVPAQGANTDPNASNQVSAVAANIADSNARQMLAQKDHTKLDGGQGERAPVQQQQPTRLLELLQSYLSSGADPRKETQASPANCQHAADDKSAQPQMTTMIQDAQKTHMADAPQQPSTAATATADNNALQGMLANGSFNVLQRLLDQQQQAAGPDAQSATAAIHAHGTSSLSNDQAQEPASAGLVSSLQKLLANSTQGRLAHDRQTTEPAQQTPTALRALQRRLSVATHRSTARHDSTTHLGNFSQTPVAVGNDQRGAPNDRNGVNDVQNLAKMMAGSRSPMQSQMLQQLLSQGGLKLQDQPTQKALAELVGQRQEGKRDNQAPFDISQNSLGAKATNPLAHAAGTSQGKEPVQNGHAAPHLPPDKSGEQVNGPGGESRLSANSSDKGAVQNAGENLAESNLALLKYIKWQDQEIQRMKTLIVLQSMQANPSQHKTAASEASQPVMTPAILSEQILQRANQLQSAKQPQGSYSYPQTKEVEHLLQSRVGALGQAGNHSAEIDRLRQMAAAEGRAHLDAQVGGQGNSGNLNHQLMNMLKIAGPTGNGGDKADAYGLLGKRRLDQVQGLESEAQIRASLVHGGNGLPNAGQVGDLSRLAGLSQPNTLPEDRRISEWRSREPDSLAQSRALISTLTDQLKHTDSAQRMGTHEHGSSQAHLNESRYSLPDADYNSDEETCKTQLIKIRQQLHANLDDESYRSCRGEVLELVRKHQHAHAMNAIVIDAKPKRAHDRVGGNGFRGSQYRGVSKNKFKWQMMIMINQKKVYLGAIRGEKIAALFYDYIAIMSQGVGAKTNFSYSATDLGRILEIFQKKEDKANYTLTGATTASIHSSALPGIENVDNSLSKRRRGDNGSDDEGLQSGIVTPKQNLKEDILLASQVFSKEASQIDAAKVQTSDSTGPKQQELTKDGFLQRLLAIQGQKGSDQGPNEQAQQPTLPLNLQLLANYLHANQSQNNPGKQSGVQAQHGGPQKFYQTPNRPKDAADYDA